MENIRSETNEELVIPQYAFFHEESLMWFGLEFRINYYDRWHIRTPKLWSLSTEFQLLIGQALQIAIDKYQSILLQGIIQSVVIHNRIELQIRAFRFQ